MKLIYKIIDWILLIAIFIILLLIYLKTPPTLSDLTKAKQLDEKHNIALELLEKHSKYGKRYIKLEKTERHKILMKTPLVINVE